jgi:hypothetical protein
VSLWKKGELIFMMRKKAGIEPRRILYFDCFAGVTAPMIIGAMLDANVMRWQMFKDALKRLDVDDYKIQKRRTKRCEISATEIKISTTDKMASRNLRGLLQILDRSTLGSWEKLMAHKIIMKLGSAEAKVHGIRRASVRLHELGRIDTLIKIVGAVILFKQFDEIYSSPLHVGRGFINCVHGRLPVPTPATGALLRGVPIYSEGVKRELVTPTGAAILTTIVKKFDFAIPKMRLVQIGYGAGAHEYLECANARAKIPHLLRVYVGEKQ